MKIKATIDFCLYTRVPMT